MLSSLILSNNTLCNILRTENLKYSPPPYMCDITEKGWESQEEFSPFGRIMHKIEGSKRV